MVGTGGGACLGMRRLRVLRGNAGSSWPLGYPTRGEAGVLGDDGGRAETAMDSGRVFLLGKDWGIGETSVKILENSRVYHSESDSGSSSFDDSSSENSAGTGICSNSFLNGWRRDAEMGTSCSGEVERELRLVMVRGLIDARRGLNTRWEGAKNSSSEEDGVIGRPEEFEKGLQEDEDEDIDGVGELQGDCRS